MSILEIIVLIIAGFFVIVWTVGLVTGHAETIQMQLAVISLWPVYMPSLLGAFSPLHLLWGLPLTVVIAFYVGTEIAFKRINKKYQE